MDSNEERKSRFDIVKRINKENPTWENNGNKKFNLKKELQRQALKPENQNIRDRIERLIHWRQNRRNVEMCTSVKCISSGIKHPEVGDTRKRQNLWIIERWKGEETQVKGIGKYFEENYWRKFPKSKEGGTYQSKGKIWNTK